MNLVRPPRWLGGLLIGLLLFPVAVSAKGGFSSSSGGRGGGGGYSSSGGGFRSGTSPAPRTAPGAGTFKSGMPTPQARAEAKNSQAAQERASRTTVVNQTSNTTVVGGGGGGGSWFLPAMLGYIAGGGCNRDRAAERRDP